MLATIALAAVALPAPGTYLYAVKTASGASVASNVTIYPTTDGLVTHEVLRTAAPLATTDQHFDAGLHHRWYSGANTRGAAVNHHDHAFVGPGIGVRKNDRCSARSAGLRSGLG